MTNKFWLSINVKLQGLSNPCTIFSNLKSSALKFVNNRRKIDNNFLIQEGFLKKKDHKKSIKLIDSIQFKKKLQFKNFKVTPGAKKRIEELGGSTS